MTSLVLHSTPKVVAIFPANLVSKTAKEKAFFFFFAGKFYSKKFYRSSDTSQFFKAKVFYKAISALENGKKAFNLRTVENASNLEICFYI